MKKLFFTFCVVFIHTMVSATDGWVWSGGKYTATKVDSITFVDPSKGDNFVDPFSDKVYDNYSGTLKLSVMGFSAGSATPVVTVADANTGFATVAVGEFSVSGYTISGLSVDNVEVEKKADGSLSLSRANFTSTALLNGEPDELTNCSLTGTIKPDGTISLSVSFSVSSFPVSGTFSGEKVE
ncbi:MAG: hypothetical protein J5875_01115 [Paludibacteraceae bacterium]|nr:hypothetical protein [Paludibacteraceae bacterium]